MANVLQKQCGFFTFPRHAPFAKLSGSALKLYCALLDLAQRHSATCIEIPAYAIGGLAGLSKNTVGAAGRDLKANGLVVITKGEHGLLAYELINPDTGALLPAPVDPRTGRRYTGIYHFTPKLGQNARTAKNSPKPSPPAQAANIPWSEINGSESQDLGTTKSNLDLASSKFGILDTLIGAKTKELSANAVSLKHSEKNGISKESKDSQGEKKADEATSFPFGFCASPIST
jgi:hypothetical protein